MDGPVVTRGEPEEILARIEQQIKQLKVQYDMFFGGGLDREPVELRARLERTLKHYIASPMPKYHQRFHFNALVSRYNSFSELWGRTVRLREEGDYRSIAAPAEPHHGEKLVARARLRAAGADDATLRGLYDRFVDARQHTGAKGSPSFEAFQKGIARQTERLRKSAGCAEIELRLVIAHDKVQLKARTGRR